MYEGRDMTELSMIDKSEWTDEELAYFHKNLQQMTPYLNAEGVMIHREIIKEIEQRKSFQKAGNDEAGSHIHLD